MPTLKDFTNNIANDSLRNILIDDNGLVAEDRIPQVISAANEALARIYARVPYRKGVVEVILSPERQEYPLEEGYALTDGWEDDLFIVDNEDQLFNKNIGTIVQIRNHKNKIIPINDMDAHFPIMVRGARTLITTKRIKKPESIFIHYTEVPAPLTKQDMDRDIPLEPTLHGALTAYMGYYIARGTPTESAMSLAMSFLKEFNMIIDEVLGKNTMNTSTSDDTSNFKRNGWV